MPKRSSLRDRLGQDQARGQEAVYGSPESAPEPVPAPTVPRKSPGGAAVASWEDTHQRVTFYCPLDLLEAVEAEMRRSGRSKTAVIVDALREHLTRP